MKRPLNQLKITLFSFLSLSVYILKPQKLFGPQPYSKPIPIDPTNTQNDLPKAKIDKSENEKSFKMKVISLYH